MRSPRTRGGHPALATIAALLAGLTLFGGLLLAYGRTQLLDAGRLSDRAVATLDEPAVRDEIARRLTVEVVRQAPRAEVDETAVRAVMTSVVESDRFRDDFRSAVRTAHQVLLDGDRGEVELRLDRAATLAADALRPTSPALADAAKERLTGFGLRLAGRRDAIDAVRTVDAARLLAVVLPVLALLLVLAAVAWSRRRALGWAWSGIAVACAGLGASLVATRGREQIDNGLAAEIRPAARATWDVLVGDLRWWGAAAFLVGALLALAGGLAERRASGRRALARTA